MRYVVRFRFASPSGWLLALLTFVSQSTHAQPHSAAPAPPTSPTQALSEALNPDGTLRPDARGAFDPRGYQMTTAPDGRPVFQPARPSAPATVTGDWQRGFGLAGVNHQVYAIAAGPGGELYVGGRFGVADTVVSPHIAMWDGTAWHRLGRGLNGGVTAIAVAGTDVYVGGWFTRAGGTPANRVAKWNGTAWSALGAGVDSTVRSIAVVGTDVYVGGSFNTAGGSPARNVARWDGTAWHALGAGTDGGVWALAAIGSDVYVGGEFNRVGGMWVSYIARWNGTAWSPVGGGVNSTGGPLLGVHALLAVGTDLYVGGVFDVALSDTTWNPTHVAGRNLLRWNGTAWSSAAGSGTGYTTVEAMAFVGSELFVAGTDGVDNGLVERYDGTSWHSVGEFKSYCYALAAVGTDVYLGGAIGLIFEGGGEHPLNGIARWNGTTWRSFNSGLDDAVWSVLVAGTDVYVGGGFTQIGNVSANGVARWDGAAWHALGTGLTQSPMSFQRVYDRQEARVSALAMLGSNLYAAGSFTVAGGITANHVARWDGAIWTPLDSGVTGGWSSVHALAVLGTDLVVAGDFTRAGTVAARNIAKWNGTAWSALGSGTNGVVTALGVAGPTLYAGGGFTQAGGVAANYVARWDGATWTSLGSGTDQVVIALAVAGSTLYAGGRFTTAGGTPASRVARWNGTAWDSLGSGLPFPVWALSASGTKLYAGGSGQYWSDPGQLAVWNDTTWSALGPGFNHGVRALATTATELYVGGLFTLLRDSSLVSAYLGIFRPVGGTLRISSFTPTAGPTGTLVTLTGVNLSGTTMVFFNGTPAPGFTVNAVGTQITVTVPPGASSGPISVTSPAGFTMSAASFDPRPLGRAEALAAGLGVALYPNPAHAEFTVALAYWPGAGESVVIVDGVGRMVRTAVVREATTRVSLAGLTPGVYAVRVAGHTRRLVVE